jgi:hypothetical protein
MIPSEEEVKIALDYEFALVEPGERQIKVGNIIRIFQEGKQVTIHFFLSSWP